MEWLTAAEASIVDCHRALAAAQRVGVETLRAEILLGRIRSEAMDVATGALSFAESRRRARGEVGEGARSGMVGIGDLESCEGLGAYESAYRYSLGLLSREQLREHVLSEGSAASAGPMIGDPDCDTENCWFGEPEELGALDHDAPRGSIVSHEFWQELDDALQDGLIDHVFYVEICNALQP